MEVSKYYLVALFPVCFVLIATWFSFAPGTICFQPDQQVWEGVSHTPPPSICVYSGPARYLCEIDGDKKMAELVPLHLPTKADVAVKCIMVPGPFEIVISSTCILHVKGAPVAALESERKFKNDLLCVMIAVVSFLVGGLIVVLILIEPMNEMKTEIPKLIKERDNFKKKLDDLAKRPESPPSPPICAKKNEEPEKEKATADSPCLFVYDKKQKKTILVPISDIPLCFLIECSEKIGCVINRRETHQFDYTYPSFTTGKHVYKLGEISKVLSKHPDYSKIHATSTQLQSSATDQ
jgi:hypothetical protein